MNKQVPDNMQKLFTDRVGGYDYRENLNFRTLRVRTTMKRMCISVSGVKVWNKLQKELKQSPSKTLFKKRLKLVIFKRGSEWYNYSALYIYIYVILYLVYMVYMVYGMVYICVSPAIG